MAELRFKRTKNGPPVLVRELLPEVFAGETVEIVPETAHGAGETVRLNVPMDLANDAALALQAAGFEPIS